LFNIFKTWLAALDAPIPKSPSPTSASIFVSSFSFSII
jgi:hypothetical protein